MDTYKEKAQSLLQAGFEPIPLRPRSKIPQISAWSTIPIDKQQVQRWIKQFGSGGVGIRLGIEDTESTLCCLDVDVDEPEMSQKVYDNICSLVNTAPCIRFGAKPRFALLCLVSKAQGKNISDTYFNPQTKAACRLELLTKGQQVVAYGIHPTTQLPYSWQGGVPEQFGLKGTPRLDILDIALLFDEFGSLAQKAGWKAAKTVPKLSTQPEPLSEGNLETALANLKTPTASLEELKQALFSLPQRYCDEREYWIEAGMILHWETQGSAAGFRLWDSWSRLSDRYGGTETAWRSFHLDRPPGQTATFGTMIDWLRNEGKDVTNVTSVTDVTPCYESDCLLPRNNGGVTENVTNQAAKYSPVTNGLWDYIQESDGEVSLSMIYQDFSLKTANEKTAVRMALKRLCEQGKLDKIPMKRGSYALVTSDLEEMNLNQAEKSAFPLPLPFDLSSHVKVLRGSVVVISGTTNAGKTTFAFQCIEGFLREFVTFFEATPDRERVLSHSPSGVQSAKGFPGGEGLKKLAACPKPVRYLNSEMSEGEILARIEAMGPETAALLKEHVQWIRRSHDWARAIDPDAVNVIDYLQIYDDFYKIGQLISDIHQRLAGGIALILIQKKTGEANPRGGEFALERARLAINLDANPSSGGGICTLRKVKAPLNYAKNPQGMELDYRLGKNMRLEAISKLMFVNKKQRAAINRRYEEERKLQEAADDFFEVTDERSLLPQS